MTPVDEALDEAFDDALRRADVRRLSVLVDAARCPPVVFERLLRHEDAPVRSLGLALLGERAAVGEPAELGALLPTALSAAGTWSAEDALVLAELYARLGPYVPTPYAVAGRAPAWRTARLPVRVQIAWLRAEIAGDPTTVRREPAGELLHHAVRGTGIAGARRPRQLIAELLDSGDPVLVGESLRLAREGLHAGVLSAALVRAHLARLLDVDAAPATVAAALAELAEPWAVLEPLPPGRLSAVSTLLSAAEATVRPEVAEAALTTLARYGESGVLRRAVDDPDLTPRLRRRALELLGSLATRDHIHELTAVATRDPLLFGEPAIACLRGLHRRGHFVTAPDVPAVIALALADHAIAPRDVATILFTCRQEMFRLLTDAPADDPQWPRRLDLLVALAGQGMGESGDIPVGDAIARALEATSAPRPFFDALRALRHTAAEEAVLTRLETEPGAALDTLEAIGGSRTVAALRYGLGLTASGGGGGGAGGVIAPHLRAVRNRALELLWQLTEDAAERRALLVRLGPADLPARIAADLGGPDEGELALLAARVDRADPVTALCGLAAHGGASTIPVIADLLLDVVAELALRERVLTERRRDQSPQPDGPAAGEAVVPGEVLEAVRELGRQLHARRRIRPICLLDASDADAAGNALAATVVLDLLDRPGPTDDERVILLELLTRVPYPHTRPRVHRMLRHRSPHVRKHVIALLAQDTEGDDAQALSASLITLTTADDIQTVRQALLALGHTRARWASDAIAACLDHPNMNIKKTAAGVLARAGTAVAVPQLLNWLARHDNPGFRTALVEALRSILGAAYEATLRAALDRAEEPRARTLLSDCLAECSAGRAALSDVDALETGGWQPAVALRIAGRRELPARHLLRALRPTHADWLALADSLPDSMSGTRMGLVRVAVGIRPSRLSDDERRTYARHIGLLLRCLTDKATSGASSDDGRDVVSVLEEVAPTLPTVEKRAVAATVRALSAVAPAPTLRLLRGCGAVLVRADLDQALAAAATARAGGAVLREAFGIPDAPASPTNSRAELAALADAYPTADPATRSALLDRMTALQPLDVPPWTLGETDADTSITRRPNRTVRADDLDQPRSAALRARLLGMLDAPDPDRRRTAALALLKWPDPELRSAVLRAYLHGRVDVEIPPGAVPAGALAALLGETEPGGIRYERLARVASRLGPSALEPLVPALLELWQRAPEAVRPVLAAVPADTLAVTIADRVMAGAWGFLDLLAGRPVLRTPELTEIRRRLRAERRDRVADSLVLVEGPLRDPAADRQHANVRARLTERGRPTAGPSRQDLLRLARTGSPDRIRRALTLLAADRSRSTDPDDPELRELIGELLHHPRPRVRLHAHRTSRALFDRATYLGHTSSLLNDPQPDVVRSAVRTLTHAGWEPAVPAIVALLDHPHPAVRGAAADGLKHLGRRVIPALRHTADHARPDRRSLYTSLLDRITAAEEERTT
ncbi:HEAT repeat domain-containing protein [Streptomyces sp. NBC_01716]|uniref:HEAT repeat domain-containing protein n=1 Tax=Streptomyces sp. NBC_01716 TaxID=2975917 RepID=UPI002E2EE3E1|nr:HEAT repeat domain-containing protein [Streptomyces sp. NBC_01716]